MEKVAFVFCFSGGEDLNPLPGGLRELHLYSEKDYVVDKQRRVYHGPTSEARRGDEVIGGTDVIIPATGDTASLDTCARIIQRYWPRARFEDVLTGQKIRQLWRDPGWARARAFRLPDASAEAAWDAESDVAARNSMIYLILTPQFVTAVLDYPHAPEMRPIIDSIRDALSMDILNTDADLDFADLDFAEAV